MIVKIIVRVYLAVKKKKETVIRGEKGGKSN